MTMKGPGRGKLADLVPDHVFRDKDRYEFLPVMNGQRQADKLRSNRGAA